MKHSLALLGTGLMGSPIAERLLSQGYALTVYNRSRDKAEALQALGAIVAHSPAEALTGATVILLVLADFQAIQVVLPSKFDYTGKTIIQMGTITPQESQKLAAQVQSLGAEYLEAPVLGSKPQAREGSLIVMAGGEKNCFEKWRALLSTLGSSLYYIGSIGQASALKLALNQMIPAHIALFGLSYAYLQTQGVSSGIFMEILRQSAIYAPTYDKKLPRLESQSYDDPNFPVKHMLKDQRLFLEQLGPELDPRMAEACAQLLEKAMDLGLAEADYSAIAEAVNSPP